MSKLAHNGVIAWMAGNPVASNLIMILLFAGGFWTTTFIQKEVEPEYELDIVQVSVSYPGAAPTEVESGIILPIEDAVRGVNGVKEITSTAREGSGSVSIELVAGADRTVAFQDIDQAVSRIRTFPDEVEQPEVRLQARQRRVMAVVVYGHVDPWTLRVLAEQLRDQLLSNPAITQIELGRALEYVTHVEIPMHKLREHELTLGDVAKMIEESSQDVPAGDVQTNSGIILLRLQERKQWADQFANIPVVTAESGEAVTLGDIATVTDGFEERGFHSQFNQTPSVQISISRVGDQSPLEISEAVQAEIAAFEANLPEGVKVRIDSSAADDYEDRLDLLLENAAMAVFIVLFLLALFLELRLAFWVMMGMSVSFVGGIIFLPWFDVSINMISMFGFLVVLGIVVDDAIVVGENIYDLQEKGGDPLDAAIIGAQEMARPVTFSILTNIVAFIPLLFIPGTTGKYWWPMPAVVIIVLLVSLFESLYILPAHLGHVAKRRNPIEAWVAKYQQKFARGFNDAVTKYFGPVLHTSLRFRYVTLAAAISLFVIVGGYGYSGHMGMVMMPEVAADEIEAGVRLPVGTTAEQAARVAVEVTEATQRMFDKHGLENVADGIKTNVRRGSFVDVELVMKPPDERDMTAREVIQLWRDEIGDIDGVGQISFEAERGPGGWRKDLEIDLSHSDVATLEKAAIDFSKRLEAYASTRDVNDNYDKGKAQFDIRLLPEGRALGLTPQVVGKQVRDAFFGALAVRQLRGTNEFEVRVKLPDAEREDVHFFEEFVVRTPSGMEVPLLDVVEIERTEAFNSITRRNGRRVITVTADVEPNSAMSRVMEGLRDDDLPELRKAYPGLTWTFEGTQSEMRESTRSLYGGFGLALAIIFALLAVAFRNYSQPLIVLSVIPFGIIGAVIGHILLGQDLSLMSVMGIVALSGVVVNDSLIMIDYANRNRGDLDAFSAIYQAGLRRFRPIMLTTVTTFGGLTPIIFETSNQANHLIPMATALGFGIVFATALVLVLVPCLYLIFEDIGLGPKKSDLG